MVDKSQRSESSDIEPDFVHRALARVDRRI